MREARISHSDQELEEELRQLLLRESGLKNPVKGYEIQAFVTRCINEGFARGYQEKGRLEDA